MKKFEVVFHDGTKVEFESKDGIILSDAALLKALDEVDHSKVEDHGFLCSINEVETD